MRQLSGRRWQFLAQGVLRHYRGIVRRAAVLRANAGNWGRRGVLDFCVHWQYV